MSIPKSEQVGLARWRLKFADAVTEMFGFLDEFGFLSQSRRRRLFDTGRAISTWMFTMDASLASGSYNLD
jgi:hypothetical protein